MASLLHNQQLGPDRSAAPGGSRSRQTSSGLSHKNSSKPDKNNSAQGGRDISKKQKQAPTSSNLNQLKKSGGSEVGRTLKRHNRSLSLKQIEKAFASKMSEQEISGDQELLEAIVTQCCEPQPMAGKPPMHSMLTSDGLKLLILKVPLTQLLNAYDQVIKSTSKIQPEQATRVYRKLLKLQREAANQQVAANEPPIRLDAGLSHHRNSMQQLSKDSAIDLTKTLSLHKGIDTVSSQFEGTQSSFLNPKCSEPLLVHVSSHPNIKIEDLESKSVKIEHRKVPKQGGRPPQPGSKQHRNHEHSVGDTLSTQQSLPKLSFADLLNKAPKPNQNIPLPHAQSPHTQESSKVRHLQSQPNIFVDEVPQRESSESDYLGGTQHFQSCAEYTLKPETKIHGFASKLYTTNGSSAANFDDYASRAKPVSAFKPFQSQDQAFQVKPESLGLDVESVQQHVSVPTTAQLDSASNQEQTEFKTWQPPVPLQPQRLEAYKSIESPVRHPLVTLGQPAEQKPANESFKECDSSEQPFVDDFDLIEKQLVQECRELDALAARKNLHINKTYISDGFKPPSPKVQFVSELTSGFRPASPKHSREPSQCLAKLDTAVYHHARRQCLQAFKTLELNKQTSSLHSHLSFAFRYRHLTQTALRSLVVNVKVIAPGERQLVAASLWHASYTLSKSMQALRSYSVSKIARRAKLARAQSDLATRTKKKVLDSIVMYAADHAIHQAMVLTALRARKKHLLRTAFQSLVYFKEILKMQTMVLIKAQQIWQANTSKACLLQLRTYAAHRQAKRRREAKCQRFVAETLKLGFKRRVFAALDRNRLVALMMYPMSHPMQLKCSLFWLELSFGPMMAAVWEDFPDNKVVYLPQIQNGRIEVLLPNFLAVSRNKRRQSFYFQANNFMAQDVLRAAFRGLKRNRRQMKKFRSYRGQRLEQIKFTIMHICSLKSNRTTERHRNRISRIAGLTQPHCPNFGKANHLSSDCSGCQSTFWQGQSATQRVQHLLFTAWRQLFLKHIYLSNQLMQIESMHRHEFLSTCFTHLKHYTLSSQMRKNKTSVARQQYTYYLGRRVFAVLKRYTGQQTVKRALYMKVEGDDHFKRLKIAFQAVADYSHNKKDKRMNRLVMKKQVTTLVIRQNFKKWHRVFTRRQAIRFMETTLDFARLLNSFLKVKEYVLKQNTKFEVALFSQEQHLMKQVFKALRKHVLRSKIQRCNAQLITVTLDPVRPAKSFYLWREAYQRRLNNYRIFDFCLLEIAKVRQKEAFKRLKSYHRVKVFKRHASLAHLTTLKQRVVAVFKKRAYARVTARKIGQRLRLMISQRKETRIFKQWHIYLTHQQMVRNFQGIQKQKRIERVFSAFKNYLQTRRFKKVQFAQQHADFEALKLRTEFQKFVSKAMYLVGESQKYLVAECFNNQFMYHASFRTWVHHFRSRGQEIERCKQAKKLSEKYKKKQMLRVWKQQARRPLRKIEAARKIGMVGWRRDVRGFFVKWLQKSRVEAVIKEKLQVFQAFRNHRSLQRYFSGFAQRLLPKIYRKMKVKSADAFYASKLQERSIKGIKVYFEWRKKINEKISMADAQMASRLIERHFVVLRYITSQMRSMKQAREVFEFAQRQKLAPLVFGQLGLNAQISQREKSLEQRSQIFSRCILMNRALVALVEYELIQKHKKDQLNRALHFHATQLVQTHFIALKVCVKERILLKEKREIMQKVIHLVDIQNLKQRAFDGFFQNLICESNEQSLFLEQLVQSKMRRIFKILQWHRDRKKILKAAAHAIEDLQNQTLRCKFFFQWRTKFMQTNLVQTFLQNKQKEFLKKVFGALYNNVCEKHKITKVISEHKQRIVAAYWAEWKNNFLRKAVKIGVQNEGDLNFYKALDRLVQLTKKRKQKLISLFGMRWLGTKTLAFSQWRRQTRMNRICEVFESPNLLAKLLQPLQKTMRFAFQKIKNQGLKFKKIDEIEREVKYEHQFAIKQRILREWADLLFKRQDAFRYINHKQRMTKVAVFRVFKKKWQKNLSQRDQMFKIISHFSNKRPQALQLVSKAFLISNFEAAVESHERRNILKELENQDLTFSKQFPNDVASRIDLAPDHLSTLKSNLENGFHLPTDLSLVGSSICNTVLMKYVLDKWRLTLPAIRRRSQAKQQASYHYVTSRKRSVIMQMRKNSLLKAKKRQILQQGREYFNEGLLKKCLRAWIQHIQTKSDIEQLKQVGAEFKQIRIQNEKHKIMMLWSELALEQARQRILQTSDYY